MYKYFRLGFDYSKSRKIKVVISTYRKKFKHNYNENNRLFDKIDKNTQSLSENTHLSVKTK